MILTLILINILLSFPAAWNLSNMLRYDDGPFNLIANPRTYLTRKFLFFKKLYSCTVCFSMWVGIFYYILALIQILCYTFCPSGAIIVSSGAMFFSMPFAISTVVQLLEALAPVEQDPF